MYAHIKYGSVVRFMTEIPPIFQGVKQFRSLTPEQRAQHGFVPVIDVTQGFDSRFHRKTSYQTTVFVDRVEMVWTYTQIDRSKEAIQVSGESRRKRQVKKLMKTDPVKALLKQGGYK